MFSSQTCSDQFFSDLNSLHPSLKFTVENEQEGKLPFLDVLVQRSCSSFTTTIYRKPTFTGLYLGWNSFCPRERKVNLIKTLVHRALMICSNSVLDEELSKITNILLDNGYPKHIVDNTIKNKIRQFGEPKIFGPNKLPIYLKIPWIGEVTTRFTDKVKRAVTRCFRSINPRIIYKTRNVLPAFVKDSIPTSENNMVVYLFKCQCGSGYVGRTTKRLQARILEHVPTSVRRHIRNGTTQTTQMSVDSSIGQHLIDNIKCAEAYSDSCFTVLHRATSRFQLRILEAITISLRKPKLCVHKDFTYTLMLMGGLS